MKAPAHPPHNRKLGITGTALTSARNPKDDVQALSAVRDELERVMIEHGYCDGAPFSWVTISIRFGTKNDQEPTYQKINIKYGDLPLAIEISTDDMQGVSLGQLTELFRCAALRALIHAGERYDRPTKALRTIAADQ